MESQKSAQVPAAPLCCACFVGRCREAPKGTVTMPVVSLDDFFPDFDRQHHWRGQHDHNRSHHVRSWFYGSNSHGLCEGTRANSLTSFLTTRTRLPKRPMVDWTGRVSLSVLPSIRRKNETHTLKLRHVLW